MHLCEETVSPSSRRDKDDRVLESIDISPRSIERACIVLFQDTLLLLSTLLLLAYFLLRREIDGSDHLAFNTVHLHSVHV